MMMQKAERCGVLWGGPARANLSQESSSRPSSRADSLAISPEPSNSGNHDGE